MKKILCLVLFGILLFASASYASGFSSNTYGKITLHTYQSDDPLGDVSFIIESPNKLTLLEPQAFAKNIKELTEYAAKLNKPVDTVLVSFHPAGLDHLKNATKISTKAMDGFMKSDAAKKMLAHFEKAFKGDMDTKIIPFDKLLANDAKLVIDGVTYQFFPTGLPGMPGSNVSINDVILYQHFSPVANTHASPFHINSKAAIDGAIKDSEKAKSRNYKLFIGSHLPGKSNMADLDFQIKYLKTLKNLVAKATRSEQVIEGMNKAFPGIKGQKNINAIAGKMFKKQ